MSKISSGIVLRKCGLESKAVRCMYLYIINAVSDSLQTLLILGMKRSSMHLIWQVKRIITLKSGNSVHLFPVFLFLPVLSSTIHLEILICSCCGYGWWGISPPHPRSLEKGFCSTIKLWVMFKHVFPGIYLPVIKFEYLLGVKYLIMKLGDCTSNAAA